MVTDQIADLLTRIRNAQSAGHFTVKAPYSTVKRRIVDVLVEEGYIASVEDSKTDNGLPELKIALRYDDDGNPVIKKLDRLSTPGRRWYVKKDEIPMCKNGLGVILVSTSKGILSDMQARKDGVGGELVCSVF